MPSPDLEGFRGAQATLREKMGRDVVFLSYDQPTYASGVVLNPDTERPYDPTILPTASAVASASVRALKIYSPVTAGTLFQQAVEESPLGIMEHGKMAITVDPDDWDANSLDDAKEVEVLNERYQIEAVDEDAIGDEPPHRIIVTLRQSV